jgi:hypothetical protein
VGEKSHVDAMRAAIRGDFERLERRRGSQELMRIADPPPSGEVSAAPEPPLVAASEERRGWLERLLGR